MRVLRGVVYMTKSSGPRIEPWGTPQEEVCQEERYARLISRRPSAGASGGATAAPSRKIGPLGDCM